MSLNREQMFKNFQEGCQNAEKNKISIHGNNGRVSMEIMFNTQDLISFLNRKRGSGLSRLHRLASVMNHPGLFMCDYEGEEIDKWVKEHEDLFSDITDEEHRDILIRHSPVYINHYGKKDEDDDEMNEYVIEKYPEDRLGKQYKDNMLWFWAGEF